MEAFVIINNPEWTYDRGYKTTAELSDEEVDKLIKNVK